MCYILLADTYSNLTLTTDSSKTYLWSEKGIAWPGEANKYAVTPGYSIDEVAPPPNWLARFPNGYTNSTPPPNLKEDEHFQNWMRTAGLPTFTKLWGRNDNDNLAAGRYQIVANLSRSSARCPLTPSLTLVWQITPCSRIMARSRS